MSIKVEHLRKAHAAGLTIQFRLTSATTIIGDSLLLPSDAAPAVATLEGPLAKVCGSAGFNLAGWAFRGENALAVMVPVEWFSAELPLRTDATLKHEVRRIQSLVLSSAATTMQDAQIVEPELLASAKMAGSENDSDRKEALSAQQPSVEDVTDSKLGRRKAERSTPSASAMKRTLIALAKGKDHLALTNVSSPTGILQMPMAPALFTAKKKSKTQRRSATNPSTIAGKVSGYDRVLNSYTIDGRIVVLLSQAPDAGRVGQKYTGKVRATGRHLPFQFREACDE